MPLDRDMYVVYKCIMFDNRWSIKERREKKEENKKWILEKTDIAFEKVSQSSNKSIPSYSGRIRYSRNVCNKHTSYQLMMSQDCA